MQPVVWDSLAGLVNLNLDCFWPRLFCHLPSPCCVTLAMCNFFGRQNSFSANHNNLPLILTIHLCNGWHWFQPFLRQSAATAFFPTDTMLWSYGNLVYSISRWVWNRVATSALWKKRNGKDEAPKALQPRRRRHRERWGNVEGVPGYPRLGGLGKRSKLPQWGPGQSPGKFWFLGCFLCQKHAVYAAILRNLSRFLN